jgi:hypothetical protein
LSVRKKALRALVDLYQVFCAGLFARAASWQPAVPGSTGSGKTRIVEAAAEILLAIRAPSLVDCAEFQHSRNRKIDWFASGYLGHRDASFDHRKRCLRCATKLKLSFCCLTKLKKRLMHCGNCCSDVGQSHVDPG